jgi:hypothetical protein
MHILGFLLNSRVDGLGIMLQAAKLAGSIPDGVTGIINLLNRSSRTVSLGSTQPLTESTRNLPVGKERPARKADNLTAICEPIV